MSDSPKSTVRNVSTCRRRLCCISVAREFYIGVVFMLLIVSTPPALCRIMLYNDTMFWSLRRRTVWVCIIVVLSLAVVAFLTLFLVVFMDPGFVSPSEPLEYPLSHRCPLCNEIVKEYDHHCSALGACIGKNNMPYFITFMLSIFLLSACGLTVSVAYVICRFRQLSLIALFRTRFLHALKTLLLRLILTLAGLTSIATFVVCFYVFFSQEECLCCIFTRPWPGKTHWSAGDSRVICAVKTASITSSFCSVACVGYHSLRIGARSPSANRSSSSAWMSDNAHLQRKPAHVTISFSRSPCLLFDLWYTVTCLSNYTRAKTSLACTLSLIFVVSTCLKIVTAIQLTPFINAHIHIVAYLYLYVFELYVHISSSRFILWRWCTSLT